MATTLEALRVHEFGVLNYNIEMLYRRLKLGTDKHGDLGLLFR